MIIQVKLDLSQYGYPSDPDFDPLTEEQWGEWQNKLTIDGCALTDESVELIRSKANLNPLDWLRIDLNNRTAPLMRQWQDRAPEQGKDPNKPYYVKNPLRLDLYMPMGFDPLIPDFGLVSVIGEQF